MPMEGKDKNAKNEYVTKGYLEEQLGEQARVIISAVDEMFGKHKKEVNERFSEVNERFSEVNERLDEMESSLEKKIDNVQTLIDGYVKAQEDFKQEFVIIKEEVRQMKQIFKEKLGVEIKSNLIYRLKVKR